MKTAAAYIRVSTEEQTELSPDSQLKLIREFAKKNDYILPDEFIYHDDGISGRTAAKRPGFNKMIGTAKISPRPFDAILVWKFSRFARNREDSIVYKSMLRKRGIDVVSISEPVGDDKMSVLIEALIEAMDEYYSINLAEEVKRGMTEKFNRGQKVSGPPIGYIIKNNEFVPDERTVPIVQDIFDMFVNRNLGYVNIAHALNDRGIKTKYGNNFENRTVQYILGNPVYIGKQRWTPGGGSKSHYKNTENVLIVDANHPAIIDTDIFEKAQEKMQRIKSQYKRYERTDKTRHAYMLRGLLKCSSCGSNLTMTSSGKAVQCYKYAHGKCKTSHNISIEKLNAYVIEDMKKVVALNDFNGINISIQQKESGTETKKLKSLLDRELSKLRRVKDAYESGVDTLEEYKDNKLKITSRINELKTEIKSFQDKAANLSMNELLKAFKVQAQNALKFIQRTDVSEEDKNHVLQTIVEKVVFDRKESKISIFYIIRL